MGHDGKLCFSAVYYRESHPELVSLTEVTVALKGSVHSVKMTNKHLIYSSHDNSVNIFDAQPIMADQVKIGFYVWVVGSGVTQQAQVTSVRNVYSQGMENVFTLHNNIVVNGIVVSCHIVNHRWQVFDSLLLRSAYKLSPSIVRNKGFQQLVRKFDNVFEDKLVALFRLYF